MAGSVAKLIERARWWCESGNLGYDQYNRWDIRVGGECDCSSLALWCCYEAGFISKPTWGYTGSIEDQLLSAGFRSFPNNGNPQPGDLLLNRKNHVAIYLGNGQLAQASRDERGMYSGGKPGDQDGGETNVRSYYNYPWDCYVRYTGTSDYKQTSTSTSGGFDMASLPTISKGSKGGAVKTCQAVLAYKYGISCGPAGADGDFGAMTDAAVKKFQTNYKVSGGADGYVGANTWKALLS